MNANEIRRLVFEVYDMRRQADELSRQIVEKERELITHLVRCTYDEPYLIERCDGGEAVLVTLEEDARRNPKIDPLPKYEKLIPTDAV